MKALSIKQPWAWLIVNGHKPLENRTWNTKYRGPILIHAGKSFDKEGYAWVYANFPSIELPYRFQFEKGGIVGMAEIMGVVEDSNSPWFCGPFGFVLAHAKPLPFTPTTGTLGFFNVTLPA